jgi:hypothetical protein
MGVGGMAEVLDEDRKNAALCLLQQRPPSTFSPLLYLEPFQKKKPFLAYFDENRSKTASMKAQYISLSLP